LKKCQAHIVLSIGDIIFIGFFIWGIGDIKRVIWEVSQQIDCIKFSNRIGFFFIGMILPAAHILSIVEHFKPSIAKKHIRAIDKYVIIIAVTMFISAIVLSNYTRNYVKNAGYIHCRKAEDNIGVISKTLVYTKDMDICEAEVEKKKATRSACCRCPNQTIIFFTRPT
jgi:hypothetical protein